MSWFTDPNCEAESLKEGVVLACAVEFTFDSGFVRVGTWPGELTIGGNVFTGLGNLVGVSHPPERVQLASERWTYKCSLTDISVIPESEIDNSYGGSVTEYEVYINPVAWTVVGYELVREGTMGRIRRLEGGSPLIEISCETRLAILRQADGWRYTTEHQEKFFSGDLGCDFTRQLDSTELIWGGYKVHPGWRGVVADVVAESNRG